ncbi:RES family NAD+ phosphorylase [Microvirga sp. TS319]|uniref:RES family NAD+ phosphorylase n=1 Tax=Microvirga sp. TS319 TaxID=3241165 RepID=UPI00351A5858
MSSTISTLDALRSEFRPFKGHCWRVVESQYVISTVPLVDTLDEQARLEDLLDDTKPPVPPACRHLHPLLYTPFRYTPRQGSRFRRAGQREGAFYTAEHVETAIAEMAFYRVLFYAEAPEALIPADFAEYTAFSVAIDTDALVDLTERQEPALSHLSDYSASQAFADLARAAGATGLRSLSVRCPNKGAAFTWLSCEVFDRPDPVMRQTWRMRLTRLGVQALCESPRLAIQFPPETATSDPRTATFAWERAA